MSLVFIVFCGFLLGKSRIFISFYRILISLNIKTLRLGLEA